MKFELLDPKKHNRTNFDCGVGVLNQYLRQFANQDQKRHLSKVYVLSEDGKILGYYSISAHSVLRSELPENHSLGGYHDIPFLLPGRLAVDKAHQNQGYGDALIYHAFYTTVSADEKVGILGMIVDANDHRKNCHPA